MYSLSTYKDCAHPVLVGAQEVMRQYFWRRTEDIGRAEAARLCDLSLKQVDHMRYGRRGVAIEYLEAVTDKATAAELFAVLAGLAMELGATAPSGARAEVDVAGMIEAGGKMLLGSASGPSRTSRPPRSKHGPESPAEPRQRPARPSAR